MEKLQEERIQKARELFQKCTCQASDGEAWIIEAGHGVLGVEAFKKLSDDSDTY